MRKSASQAGGRASCKGLSVHFGKYLTGMGRGSSCCVECKPGVIAERIVIVPPNANCIPQRIFSLTCQ